MSTLFFNYIYSVKNIAKRCGKCALLFLLLIIVLPLGLSGITACNNSGIDMPSYIPPDYLDCIELTPVELGDYFFDYKPLYFWLPTADEILSDEPIIIKNIEISEKMLNTRTNSLIKVTDNIIIEALKGSDLDKLKVGQLVDILGICKGISNEWSAVILKDCFIEPSGRLQLPLEGEATQGLFDY